MDIGKNMATCQDLTINASKDVSLTVGQITINSIRSEVGTPFNKSMSHLVDVISIMSSESRRLHETDCEKPTDQLLVDYNLCSDSVNAAYFELNEAKNKASKWCKWIADELETNSANRSETEENLRATEAKIETAEIELKKLSDEVEEEEEQVRKAQNELAEAERDLSNKKSELAKKEKDRNIVTGVGAGVVWIPIFGWIAGGTMLVVSATALTSAVRCAETAVKSTRERVEREEKKLNETRQRKQEADDNLVENNTILQQLKAKVDSLKQENDELQDFQLQVTELNDKIKKCTCKLGTIWASTKVLQTESKNLYSLESLVYPLQDIMRQIKGQAMVDLEDAQLSLKFDDVMHNMIMDSPISLNDLTE